MASERNGILYIGVTKDLIRRVYEHKTDAVSGFTSRYQAHNLVWYEHTPEILSAIQREKQLKKLAACVEDPPDRGGQPLLERPLPRPPVIIPA